ncbi:MAG: aspartyl protease family protein [Candidatus Bathyarchaeia archaeon]
MDIRRGLDSADDLFKAGRFEEAERVYSKIIKEDPENHRAVARIGHIALLANRLDDAERWLTKAIRLEPEDQALKSLLAEVYYRRDEFKKAAPLLRAIGREAMARKLESFRDVLPYQIEEKAEVTDLKFVMTDPLPVVQVRVNNSELVNFFIDTGGAVVIIDTEFAKEIGAVQFGSEMGTFAGGKKAGYQHGRVDSLTLGDFTIKNIPTSIMDIRRFSPIFGGRRVDGVIGTVLLYHFFPTLDYPEGRLILRRRTEQNLRQVEEEAVEHGSIVVPFWMAGDHYMVAWGTVNNSEPMLFFVDTGLAGGGFICPESTLQKAGIKLQEDQAREGLGGGGRVRSIPFVVDELTLGDAKEHNIRGVYMGGDREYVHGFHIGGTISHTFFRNYAFTLDFTKMRYFLKRKE